jgi:hypothetical protein
MKAKAVEKTRMVVKSLLLETTSDLKMTAIV